MNVSAYTKPDLNWKQMEHIRLGLEAELDIPTCVTTDSIESRFDEDDDKDDRNQKLVH